MSLRTTPFYPFLAAVYPVIGLLARNTQETLPPHDVAGALILSLFYCSLILFGTRAVSKDTTHRGLIALAGVILFSTFGARYHLVAGTRDNGLVALGLLAFDILLLLLVARTLRSLPRPRRLTAFLNLTALFATSFALATLIYNWPRHSANITSRGTSTVHSTASNPHSAPDFYIIILDGYTGSHSLLANYGYDNTPFAQALRERGFYVPQYSRANYVHTFLSLASMLNMRYLTQETSALQALGAGRSALYPLIENNRLARELKGRGYRYVFFPTHYAPTAGSALADRHEPDPSAIRSEFFLVWLRTTPLAWPAHLACGRWSCNPAFQALLPEPAELIDWRFERLVSLEASDRPTFVFAHFLTPHDPYIYRSDCRRRAPYEARLFLPEEEQQVKDAYVQQLQCVNNKVLKLVDGLHAKTKGRAIIVIQSDHGFGRLGRQPRPYRDADPEQMHERANVFGAYYVPSGAAERLFYDSITPVNVFRSILRREFDAPLAALPDVTYWSEWERPYDLNAPWSSPPPAR